MRGMRIGHGYDVHRLAEGRKLILGGVEIKNNKGLLGYSDADVLVHAVMDALLGAAALGDIGKFFPDSDPIYNGADSMKLLSVVCDKVRDNGFEISNIDSTIVAESPQISPYIDEMRGNIARVCKISRDQINIKATTEEKLGFTGKKEGICAHAVCLLKSQLPVHKPEA